ncbi:alanine racemase [Dermabacter sp. p3-SID358]|uniref:alanine racemase n=1 Tax=Dermabacter sp. p3-SID358 TaxID=2916114 RepID=UPI0021A6399B|nr:alanine racemase [Dermabacter sp. p3-SID358]MCT1867005.1 alanine racemase [Dermabacter sp. p3-SID358]
MNLTPDIDPLISPNRAEISLKAIAHNASQLRAAIPDYIALMAVVKADGYGHGMVEAARAAIAGGATWLGVAHPATALDLARANLDVPILAWLHEPVSAKEVLPHAIGAGVDLAVSSLAQLEAVIDAAHSIERRARIHVALDTGMGREGAFGSEVEAIGAAIRESAHVSLAGAMSHLYNADVQGDASVREQAARFDAMCERLEAAAGPIPLRHLSASAGALAGEEFRYDMVRPGITVYGYSSIETDLDLRPVMSLTSRISLVKRVEAGQVVGYGAQYVTGRPTTLALVPIGYADGLDRRLTNRLKVLVQTGSTSTLVPQVGTISMDQIVLDLGPETDAGPGDRVVIFGDPNRYPGVWTANDLAREAGTIPYEILTSVSSRVPRVVLPLAADPVERTWSVEGERPAPRSFTVRTRGAEDTRRAARAIAHHAKAGDLFVLDGPLGAGKTTFTQGFARALDVRGNVASPTFVIARVHPANAEGPDLVHVDAYRLDEDWDIEDLDLDSNLDTSITLVEWGRDRVEHLASSYAIVELHREESLQSGPLDEDPDDTDEERSLTVTFVGERYTREELVRIGIDLREAGFSPEQGEE